jgi:hypothetical protein
MHKYWKEYGGNSYYFIYNENQVMEWNPEKGQIKESEKKDEIIAIASSVASGKAEILSKKYVPISEEDFDSAILSIIKTGK